MPNDVRTPSGLRFAYLMSRYPAISHTFFFQEILGLRNLGLAIETASINPPDRVYEAMPLAEQREADSTLSIKTLSSWRVAAITLRVLLMQPASFFRGLRATVQLQPMHISRTLYALFYFIEALIVGDWMQRRRLDHMHIHFCGAVATVGMIASDAFRIPYSLTVHGPDEFFEQDRFFLKQKFEAAQFVVCISDFCRSQVMRICSPEHWDKLQVVRLGICPKLFPQAGPKPGEDEASLLEIITVGRLVPAKGQLLLLRSLLELKKRNLYPRVRLVGDGVDRAHLESFVQQHGLASQVTFLGALNHEATRAALATASLFVLPSFAEGIPVALMEAMAMGIPCISTFVAGIPELIRHEEDGLLVAAGSVDDLARAIEQLALDPTLRHRFAASARERVLTDYNLPLNLEKLAGTFRARITPSRKHSHG